MSHLHYIRLQAAGELSAVPSNTLKHWAQKEHVPMLHSKDGLLIERKGLRKCLAKHDVPIPEELESKPRILIVDDDPDLLTLSVWNLHRLWPEASIHTAHDGDSGARKLMQFKPELLITDLRMPGCDGMVLASMVRENRELAHTKVLALTAYNDPETRWEVFQSGAHEFLTKPFEPRELRESAQRLLGLFPEESVV